MRMIVIIIISRSGGPTKDCDLALFESSEKYTSHSILTPKYPPETVTPHYLLEKLYSVPKSTMTTETTSLPHPDHLYGCCFCARTNYHLIQSKACVSNAYGCREAHCVQQENKFLQNVSTTSDS